VHGLVPLNKEDWAKWQGMTLERASCHIRAHKLSWYMGHLTTLNTFSVKYPAMSCPGVAGVNID